MLWYLSSDLSSIRSFCLERTVRTSTNKWWLLPPSIIIISALIALNIIVFQPAFINRSSAVAPQSAGQNKAAADCSGASSTDYACYQERFQNLVRLSGVEAAFDELKDEHEKNDYVYNNCHQMTHVIGRAAADLYGDIPSTLSKGDDFCGSGYYHGAMEDFVANVGPQEILEKANTLCADPAEHQNHSFVHRECVHGVGHGLMVAQENEVLQALQTCDTLIDDWEKENCYDGVFMENTMAEDSPSHPTKYLDADRPLYPCTDVQARYKNSCYRLQVDYALGQQDGRSFPKVFELCAAVEDEFRPSCYQGLGWSGAAYAIYYNTTDAERDESTRKRCMKGKSDEAQSNCAVGAAKFFVKQYRSDEQAKHLCKSFDANFYEVCLRATDEYYQNSATNQPLSS
jgi:hypothetical protein